MSYVMQFSVPCFMTHYVLYTQPHTVLCCTVLYMVEFPNLILALYSGLLKDILCNIQNIVKN